jgi:hypothetical protein
MHESRLFPVLSRGWNPSMCALPGLGDTRSPLKQFPCFSTKSGPPLYQSYVWYSMGICGVTLGSWPAWAMAEGGTNFQHPITPTLNNIFEWAVEAIKIGVLSLAG